MTSQVLVVLRYPLQQDRMMGLESNTKPCRSSILPVLPTDDLGEAAAILTEEQVLQHNLRVVLDV